MKNITLPYSDTYIYDPALKDYWQLLKPRVMSLVIFTGLCGLLLAPDSIHPLIALTALLSLAVGAGGSGCLNMWWERKTDALMKRTELRPLPSGRIHSDAALSLGVVLSAGSVLVMMIAVNYMAAFLLAFTIFFYFFIYTIILKPRTVQNIVIGGAAGALPPVIGWAAVTGTAPLEAWSLFLIIFLWTPAHFWALCLHCQHDYKNASIPMLPCIKGDQHTKKQIIVYTILTIIASSFPYFLGLADKRYAVIATILGIIFLFLSLQLYLKNNSPLKLFTYSIFYLFLLFLSLLI